MKKILVIEDDAVIRSSILKFLEAEAMEATSAADGESGVALARTESPDLIICDIMMPGWDGYKVLEQLRIDPNTAGIPFIFLSAKAERSDLRQGMELGADDYLTKPFTRKELLAAIAARFNKREAVTQPYMDAMKQAANNLKQLAYRDPLTGLPNRILFHHHLQEAIQQNQDNSTFSAVFYLHVDNYRGISDRLGQDVADEVLQAIAERLQQANGDINTLSRLGTAEFGILCPTVERRHELAVQAQQILNNLLETYWMRGQWVSLQLSLGIALHPDNGTHPNELMQHARLAMHQAKRQGENNYQFYSLEIDAEAAQQRLLASHLPSALARDELQLQFQPQLHLITGRIIGAEALIRWHHPDLGVLYPGSFLEIAEAAGLLEPIEQWVLQTACEAAKDWQTNSQLPLKILVNLSSAQLQNFNLLETVARTLDQTGLSPDLLAFDVKEADLMEDIEASVALLQQFKHMGIRVLIDDFGIGCTSLSYLKRLPLEGVKIDTSLIDQIDSDPEALSIVRAIVAVSQSLQLRAVAEGVETEAQANHLRQIGCYAAQGRFLCPPLSATDFQDYLAARRTERGA